MAGVFVQKLDDLGFLRYHTTVTQGDDGAPPVAGEHHPLIGPDPGEVRGQVRPVNPGDRRAQVPVRHPVYRTAPHPQQGSR